MRDATPRSIESYWRILRVLADHLPDGHACGHAAAVLDGRRWTETPDLEATP